VFRWGFTQNGQFRVKSMYSTLITGNIWDNKFLWKLKLSLKIKNFLWYLNKVVTLTKGNLARRNWTRSKSCILCAQDENIQHLNVIPYTYISMTHFQPFSGHAAMPRVAVLQPSGHFFIYQSSTFIFL
jgi:hypothetical protein